jgi:arginase
VLTGRCWRQIAETVPGFSPVRDERVISVGGRDASAGERKQLESIASIRENQLDDPTPLDVLAQRVRRVYLHVDLDIHGAESLRANGYASPGGPSASEVQAFVRRVGERFEVAAAAITAFDPAADTDGRALTAALEAVAMRTLSRGRPQEIAEAAPQLNALILNAFGATAGES